jgi:integrase
MSTLCGQRLTRNSGVEVGGSTSCVARARTRSSVEPIEAVEDAKTLEEAERARGTYRERSGQTFGEYLDDWFARKEPRLARSTFVTYRGYEDRELIPRLGEREIQSLAPGDFDTLAAELEKAGKAAATIRQVVAIARSALSDAVRLGIVSTNAATNVPMPLTEPTAGQEIPVEHLEEIREALVALAPNDGLRAGEKDTIRALVFDVALATGMRFSELAGLRWRSVDFEARSIEVVEAIVLGESKKPKSGRGRVVPMFATAQTALRAIASRALERGIYAPDELVLTSPRGRTLNPSSWSGRVWRPALEEAGLDKAGIYKNGYRFHDLRHSTVSRLIAQGGDIAVAQAVAGHSSAATTLRIYSHLTAKRLENVADQFDPGLIRA